MKNEILILLIFICLLSSSINGQSPNNYKKTSLKGKVKSVRKTFLYNNKWGGEEEYVVFNKMGYKIKSLLFHKKDTIHSITKIKYNDNNKATSITTKFPSDDGKSKKITFKYDGSNLIEKVVYENKKLYSKTIYQYNEDNRLINEAKFNEDKERTSEFTYLYNEKGNQIEKCRYRYGKRRQKYTYQYDLENNLLRRQLFNIKNQLEREHNYFYDLNHNLEYIIEKNYSDFDYKLMDTKTSTFNDKELLLERATIGANHLFIRKTIYEYNEFGEILLWKEYDRNGDLRINNKYEMTYDKNNNLIKHIQFNKGIIGKVIVNKIEYY